MNAKWPAIVAITKSPGVVWTENIWSVFRLKKLFSNSCEVLSVVRAWNCRKIGTRVTSVLSWQRALKRCQLDFTGRGKGGVIKQIVRTFSKSRLQRQRRRQREYHQTKGLMSKTMTGIINLCTHFRRTSNRLPQTLRNRPMTDDKLYISLSANTIMAKLTYNIITWQTLFTWLWRWLPLRLSKRHNNSSFQIYPQPPRGRSHYANYWYSWVQTIYYDK